MQQLVFISHAHKDSEIASLLQEYLEKNKVKCWIAPRDILPGTDWSEAIIKGINSANAMVVVLSSQSNKSRQIPRETERAVNRGIPVIPVRLEPINPEGALEYFLSTQHWIDLFPPPIESHLPTILQSIIQLLDRDREILISSPSSDMEPCKEVSPVLSKRYRIVLTLTLVIISTLLLTLYLIISNIEKESKDKPIGRPYLLPSEPTQPDGKSGAIVQVKRINTETKKNTNIVSIFSDRKEILPNKKIKPSANVDAETHHSSTVNLLEDGVNSLIKPIAESVIKLPIQEIPRDVENSVKPDSSNVISESPPEEMLNLIGLKVHDVHRSMQNRFRGIGYNISYTVPQLEPKRDHQTEEILEIWRSHELIQTTVVNSHNQTGKINSKNRSQRTDLLPGKYSYHLKIFIDKDLKAEHRWDVRVKRLLGLF